MKALAIIMLTLAGIAAQGQATRLENLHSKTILLFTPHPDDDKGSYDPDMTSQRLAGIRKMEEEISEGHLGTDKENIMWLGYDDGMLEYAPQPKLVEEATAIIRRIRPDVLLSVDPGEWYERWHKTDHRMAAFNTIDAVRAAEFHLYYPEHLRVDKLQPYIVPNMYFFYTTTNDAKYYVNIDATFDFKVEAISKQVSQFEPAVTKYRPDWEPQ